MSRLTDALMVLLGKCTPEGAHPDGNNVDEIVECIARHYTGKPYVVYLTWNADQTVLTADRGYKETYEAVVAGRNVYAVDNLGCVWSPWCFGTNFAQFMHLRSGGQYYVAKLRASAGECDLIRADFDTANESRFVVNVNADGNTITSASKTYAEILAAHNAGKEIVVNMHGSYFQLISVAETNFRFSRVFVKSTSSTALCGLVVESDDKWTYDIHDVT